MLRPIAHRHLPCRLTQAVAQMACSSTCSSASLDHNAVRLEDEPHDSAEIWLTSWNEKVAGILIRAGS